MLSGNFSIFITRAAQPSFQRSCGVGFSISALLLQNQAQKTIARDDIVDQPNALRGLDQQRRDHPGKNHDVGQAQESAGLRAVTWEQACVGRFHPAPPVPEDVNKLVSGEVISSILDATGPKKFTLYLRSQSPSRLIRAVCLGSGTSMRRKPFW